MGYYKKYYYDDGDFSEAKVIKFTEEDRQMLEDLTNVNILEDINMIANYLVNPSIEVREAAQIRYNELSPCVSSDSEEDNE